VEVEEVGEAGVLGDGCPAPPTCGSGLRGGRRYHRRLQSLLLPPSLLLFLRQVGGRTGEWFPPRRLGLGDPRGVSSAALIAVGGAGHVDGQDAARGGGARGAPLSLWPSVKVAKVGDDDGDIIATPGDAVRVPLASD
jgi:hypothetical protein